MTTKFAWTELKKLVVIDHDINQCKKNISQEQASLEHIREPLAALSIARDRNANTVRECQKRIDSLELNLAQLRQQDSKKKNVLDTLSHPKEYHALEKELAEIERQTVGIENQVVALLEEQEAAQKGHDTAITDLAAKEEEIARSGQDVTARISEQEEHIEELEKQWEEQVSNVPAELSRSYAEIRSRVPNPVVPIVSSSCSACFYGLLHQDTVALNTQTVIRCRGCYRFLFSSPEVLKTPTAS